MSTLNQEMLDTFKKYLQDEGTMNDLAYKFYSKLNSVDNVGFKDMLSSINAARLVGANAPTFRTFGPTGAWEALDFDVNDAVFLLPFHANHDIKPNGKAYVHMHWSTNGTNTQPVRWRIDIQRAKGHNQGNFAVTQTVFVQQAAHGTAWRHMVTEASEADVLIMTEPDELFLIKVTRVTNGGTDNTDQVFGIMCDLHYEADRDFTPNKAPDFYV